MELSLRGIRGCGASDRSLPKLKWSRKPDPGMLRRRGLWRGTMLDPPQIIPPRRQHVDTFVHIARETGNARPSSFIFEEMLI